MKYIGNMFLMRGIYSDKNFAYAHFRARYLGPQHPQKRRPDHGPQMVPQHIAIWLRNVAQDARWQVLALIEKAVFRAEYSTTTVERHMALYPLVASATSSHIAHREHYTSGT